MAPSKVWFMDARARRFLESTAIKGRQILERSGWLDNLKRGDIVAVKTHMGEAYNVGYLRPVIISTLIDLLKDPGLARGDQIVAVPTLVRKLPVPVRKIIGDLSNTERVLVGLDLRPAK